MSWIKAKIGKIITLKRGYDLPSYSRIEGTVPIISSSGLTDYHNQIKKTGPGVIIGRYGTLGEVFYVEGNYWPLNTTLYVTDFKGNIPKFIYYFLKTLKLERFNGAAAVPGLDRNVLHKLEVSFPKDPPTQKKIASILSAYDELIENNNQRIKLLEEMAEEIYKEWFVRLRFPKYQEAKFFDKEGNEVPNGTTDALPEGWKIVKLNNYIGFEKGVEPGSKNYESEPLSEDYIPFLRVGDLGSRESNIFIKKELSKDKFTTKNDILITLDGTVGKVAMGLEGCYSSGLRKIVYKTNLIRRAFAYLTLLSASIQGTIQAHAAGTTILHASGSIKFMKIKLPSEKFLLRFEALVNPMLEETLVLKEKNQVLQETRDLLLPRLISGKLSVENIEVEQNLENA
jgi:type I restriction enzyme S subunit